MLLVYTHKITPRLRYTFKHICKRILNIDVDFTSKVEDFIAHNSLKMSYTKQPLSNEVFVKSHELLFEQGLSDIDVNVQKWDDTKGFFTTGDRSNLPFDIFAASFYLLSRYEEYLPHVKDDYGRFLSSESIAKKHNFLQQPIVDIWAYKLQEVLKIRFPDFEFPKRKYNVQPVIDVPSAFYFKQKGLLRTIGGFFADVFRLRFKQLYQRTSVLSGFKRDPYDTFKWIINRQKTCNYKFTVFFLIGNYSTYDKNISVNKKQFVSLIKSVGDYCNIGLKASYFALEDIELLKKEKQKLESITKVDLDAVRNSFSKLNLPKTYRNLVELEIHKDYTMGYVNELGFRAGTCTPFQFYDLDYEVQTPLQINPYHCLDYVLLKHKSLLDKREHLQRFISEIKAVNGTFVPVFHNYSFADHTRWEGFKELFNIILDSAND
ncbi:polysaccharide deacetylase family protein [Winogradskyella immobilis]|uniref:Polysaccharide deacetylase family protein n=1 Tax=Winogradskyella immobilis TaxID=2816852 RepID=A0ABS8ENV7_9FLAO|nr:polysaccharide deacetylase family protein [Winogradskyella immobilis]MCC1484716.1 polysaccharide deacetylase family protein [Winogradskyella immobilis]MCG0016808.1 polysaccharide deacetylase family protein [Winogradskyella immobilis]